MLIICIVVALLVSALLCLVMLGHHIERQRQRDIVFARLVRQRRIQPCVKVDLDSTLEPVDATTHLMGSAVNRSRLLNAKAQIDQMRKSLNRRYDDAEPANPLHFAAPYQTPSRSNDCAAIGVDMAAAADRTVVTHCHAPSSYSHGGSDSYSCSSSDSSYSSSSCDSSSSSSGCD